MTEDQIKEKVKSILKKVDNDQEIENPKIDFKKDWYKLNENGKAYYEFLKDTSAISNTFGLDGYIIIGYDEKKRTYHDTKFIDCELGDTSKIYPLINKNITDPFDINIYDIDLDGHLMSVIHLPPSINKPHVIKLFKKFDKKGNIRQEQNRIFIRKSTGIFPASKYDLELMYYDKKNNIPEYEIRVDATKIDFREIGTNIHSKRTQFVIYFTIENLGRRVIAINDMTISVEFPDEQIIEFVLEGEVNPFAEVSKGDNKAYIIKSNDISYFTKLVFTTPGTLNLKTKNELLESKYSLRVELANGKIIESKIN